jgi:predicted outer membrane repeat protein
MAFRRSNTQKRRVTRPSDRRRLRLEPLEDRRLLASLTVNSPLDNTIAGDGLVTIREAILAANADTTTDLGQKGNFVDVITFDFGHDGPQTIALTMGQLVINSDLTITGAGRDLLTIDVSGSDTLPDVDNGTGSRIFDITLQPTIGWNVTLRGMTLTGGDPSGNGGAIQAAGHLALVDVLIVTNAATGLGGGVYTTHRLTVNSSALVDNESQLYGGGVYAAGPQQLEVNNSHISGNASLFRGGGIFADYTDLTLNDCTITNNLMTNAGLQSRGGGIYVRGASVVANNVVISANDASAGGGIYTRAGRLTLNHCEVKNNEARAGGGGGIYALASRELSLNSSIVSGNRSTHGGGAIFAHRTPAAIFDCIIANNESSARGGGILVYSDSLRVVRSRVTGNMAAGSGGGLISYYFTALTTPIYVADSIVDNNHAGGSGGAVYADQVSLSPPTITRSILHGNTANSGGAVSARLVTSFNLSDSTISGNHAVTSGGGIVAERSSVSLVRSTVTGNSTTSKPDGSEAGGGIFADDRSTISLSHAIVAGNNDPSNLGPDLYLFPNPNGTMLSATFSLIGDNRGTDQPEAPVGSPSAAGNLIGGPMNGAIDPLLGPLVYNGGPILPGDQRMLTHALLPGSPAIDTGDPAAVAGMGNVPLHDQRGTPFSRVANGDDIPEARIDIGTFEWQLSPLPGDYNYSGTVDAADYALWRKSVGATNDLRADGDGSGVVDQNDYEVWRANFGRSFASLPIGSAIAETWQPPASPGGSAASVDSITSIQIEATAGTRFTIGVRELRADSSLSNSKQRAVDTRRTGGVHADSTANRDAALIAWLAAVGDDDVAPALANSLTDSRRASSNDSASPPLELFDEALAGILP